LIQVKTNILIEMKRTHRSLLLANKIQAHLILLRIHRIWSARRMKMMP